MVRIWPAPGLASGAPTWKPGPPGADWPGGLPDRRPRRLHFRPISYGAPRLRPTRSRAHRWPMEPGQSIWYRFSHTPGRTLGGPIGDRACDHYRRWESDIELMRELGLKSYRFSLSWSRLMPEGTGRVNRAGVDFYSRLIDRLLERGITPMVTLYHWDLPAALEDRGGWLNPDVVRWFADYAALAFRSSTAIACRCGPRSTSRGWSLTTATSPAATRPGIAICSRSRASRSTCCCAHGDGGAGVSQELPAAHRAGGQSRTQGRGQPTAHAIAPHAIAPMPTSTGSTSIP